jgi:hypothetical protein
MATYLWKRRPNPDNRINTTCCQNTGSWMTLQTVDNRFVALEGPDNVSSFLVPTEELAVIWPRHDVLPLTAKARLVKGASINFAIQFWMIYDRLPPLLNTLPYSLARNPSFFSNLWAAPRKFFSEHLISGHVRLWNAWLKLKAEFNNQRPFAYPTTLMWWGTPKKYNNNSMASECSLFKMFSFGWFVKHWLAIGQSLQLI